MKNILLAASLALPLVLAQAQDKPLSADEIRTLVTGKTLEFPEDASGFATIMALETGGAGNASFLNNRRPRANYNAPVKWQINDKGELCLLVQRTGFNEKCGLAQKAQGGSYDRLVEGKVDSTFKVR